MPIPATEAERSPICARARFRQVTEGALQVFLNRVIAASAKPEAVADAGYDLRVACKRAAEEYRKNLGLTGTGSPADDLM